MRIDDDQILITKLNALKASLGAAFAGLQFHVRTLTLDSALTDADTAQTISIADDNDGNAFPANARPLAAYVYQHSAIAGTAISAVTVSIGDAGNSDELFAATDIFATAAGDWLDFPGAYTPLTLEATAYVPVADFVSTGGNVAAVTGTITCVLVYWKLANPFTDGFPIA
ncbi:MAG: hypothetical protein IPH07_24150 [Deltaproteobacteria bacterium]|nr:hypothetical protein [Deltaproteobacteria bacterium]